MTILLVGLAHVAARLLFRVMPEPRHQVEGVGHELVRVLHGGGADLEEFFVAASILGVGLRMAAACAEPFVEQHLAVVQIKDGTVELLAEHDVSPRAAMILTRCGLVLSS